MAHLSGDPRAGPGLPRRRRHPPRDRRRDLRRAARRRHRRPAPLHQGRQLRPDLRHGRVRPRRSSSASSAPRRSSSSTSYFARYPGVADYMERTRERARGAGLRRDGVRPAAVAARHQGGAAGRGARAPSARRSTRRCRARPPTSSSSRCSAVQDWLDAARLSSRLILQVHDELVLEVPAAELATVQRELPGKMTGVAEPRRAARRRRRRRPQLGTGALTAGVAVNRARRCRASSRRPSRRASARAPASPARTESTRRAPAPARRGCTRTGAGRWRASRKSLPSSP